MRKILFFILMFLILPASLTFSEEKTFTIGMLYPHNDPFWQNMMLFMRAGANSLNVQLKEYYYSLDKFKYLQLAETALQGSEKIDALITNNHKQLGHKILQMAENVKVPVFLIHGKLTEKQIEIVGNPREKNKYWIGEMLPDDIQAANMIASEFIKELQNKTANKKINLMGINGGIEAIPAKIRLKAFQDVIKEKPNINHMQVVHIPSWGKEDARLRFINLFKRYPQTNAVWCANYTLATGIIAGANELKLVAGKDFYITTFDYSDELFQQIKKNMVFSTIGGHFLEGLWSFILVYDYLNGTDFAEENLSFTAPMVMVSRKNVREFLGKMVKQKLTMKNISKIDFRYYSKKWNKTLKKYDFDVISVIHPLNSQQKPVSSD